MPGNKGLLKNSTALQPQIGLPKILGYGSGLAVANASLVNYFCATSTSGLYQCQVVSGKAAWVPVTSGSTGGGGGGSIIGSGLSGSIAMWVSNSGLGNSFITRPGLSINVTAGSSSPATSGGTPATSAGIVTIQGGTGGTGSTGATSGSASSGGPVYIQGGTGGAGFTVNPPTPGGPVYIQGGTGGNGSGTIPGSGGSVYILGGIPGLSGTFNNGTAGNVNIYGGMASGNQGFQGGSVFIDAGNGVSENGQISIGTSNATVVNLANANTNVSILGEFINIGQSGSYISVQPAGGGMILNAVAIYGTTTIDAPGIDGYNIDSGPVNLQLGITNATGVSLARSGITTNIQGFVSFNGASGTPGQIATVTASGIQWTTSTTQVTNLTSGQIVVSEGTSGLTTISGGLPGQQLFYVSGRVPTWSNFTGGFAPGTILMYGSATAPPGWLNCDGTSYPQNTYAALYNVIGSTYGSIASGYFNVPDMRGRVAVGQGTGTGATISGTGLISGGSALTNRAMGAWLGEEKHTLVVGEGTVESHTHPDGMQGGGGNQIGYVTGGSLQPANTGVPTTANATSGHNTMQPSNTLNYIICATGAGSSTWNASYPTRATMFMDEMISSTTVINSNTSSEDYCYLTQQNSAANGDNFTLGFFLAGGTYTLSVLGATNPNNGKIDWYIDGVLAVTGQDWYSAGAAVYNVTNTASVTVNGNGVHILKGVINGKNASAGGYLFMLAKAWLEPATDVTNIAPPSQIGHVNDFRLTAYSGIAVTTSDQTLVPTLYLTPKGNTSGIVNNNGAVISLFYQGSWGNYQATSVSQSIAACTSGTAYDAYAFYSGSAIGISTTAWSNTTTPPARALQDGQLVQSGSPQFRYMGSFYANGSGTTEDSAANRYLWNYYNRHPRQMQYISSATDWTYSTAAWRQAGAQVAYQLNCMLGMDIDVITARVHVPYTSTAAADLGVGVGIDSTTSNVAQIFGATISAAGGAETNAFWTGHVGSPGRHSLNWLEYGYGAATLTFYSTGFGLPFSAGITGEVMA